VIKMSKRVQLMSWRPIIFRARNRSLWELLHLNHLNKEEAIHVNRIISKCSNLFRLADEPLGDTDVTVHKIVTTDDKAINTK